MKKIESTGTRIASSHYLPKLKELRTELEDESIILSNSVDKILDEQDKSYFEIQKDRDPRHGPLRIGTSLSLNEDFYCAMWLYQFKS